MQKRVPAYLKAAIRIRARDMRNNGEYVSPERVVADIAPVALSFIWTAAIAYARGIL